MALLADLVTHRAADRQTAPARVWSFPLR